MSLSPPLSLRVTESRNDLQACEMRTADLVENIVVVLAAVNPLVQIIAEGFRIDRCGVRKALLLSLFLLLRDLTLCVFLILVLGSLVVLFQCLVVAVIVVVDLRRPSAERHVHNRVLFVCIRFQVLFHSPPGVLFAFPSRYWFTTCITFNVTCIPVISFSIYFCIS